MGLFDYLDDPIKRPARDATRVRKPTQRANRNTIGPRKGDAATDRALQRARLGEARKVPGVVAELVARVNPIFDAAIATKQGDALGVGLAAGLPAVGKLKRLGAIAKAADKESVVLRHYSAKGDLKTLDPKFMGSGEPGAERARPKRPKA